MRAIDCALTYVDSSLYVPVRLLIGDSSPVPFPFLLLVWGRGYSLYAGTAAKVCEVRARADCAAWEGWSWDSLWGMGYALYAGTAAKVYEVRARAKGAPWEGWWWDSLWGRKFLPRDHILT